MQGADILLEFQSTLPYGSVSYDCYGTCGHSFNPHSLTGVFPQYRPSEFFGSFNPHSLTGVFLEVYIMHENTMFQSTLPYGSVSIARLSAKDLSVSIHTPLRECFEPNERLSNHVYVSIHTPLRECFDMKNRNLIIVCFNPHSLMGVFQAR